MLTTSPALASSRCGEGGACRWRLAGGRIVRIAGSRPVTVRGYRPLHCSPPLRVASPSVEPAGSGVSSGRGPIDWPRVAGGGRVEIRDTKTTRLVTSFRPRGLVRAIALSVTRAAVLVETKSELRIEWYDADSGARLGAFAVPSSTAHRISTDGRFAAFAAGKTLRVLDLATGRQRIVARAPSKPVGLSVWTGRLVWGENGGSRGRIRTAAAAG